MVKLITDRLTIVTPDERHIEDVFRIMSTRFLAEHTGFKKMEDISEAEGKIRWAMRTDNMLVISKTSENKTIGIILLTPKEIGMPRGTLLNYEIGYFLEMSSQGNGYMTEALARMKDYLFNARKADRLTIYLEPSNAPSRKVAIANGFRFSHIEKDAGYKYDGTLVDLEYYILDRSDSKNESESSADNYLNSQKWINEGGILFPIPGSASLLSTPGNGVFRIYVDPRTNRFGLEKIAETFNLNFKIYGTESKVINNRIIQTWESELFRKSGKNLGVIFNGVKGTGKTIAAKLLCNRLGLPTIVISHHIEGLLEFIQSLNFEATILIDEAEKTFCDESEILLNLIDGVYNTRRKLYILTTNRLSLDNNLFGRPGRIRYIKHFGNLELEVINEVIKDTLTDKTLVKGLLQLVNNLEISTIDILKSLIEECNITGQIPNPNLFNVPLSKYKVRLFHFEDLSKDKFETIKQYIAENKPASMTIEQWLCTLKHSEDDNNITWKGVLEKEYECRICTEFAPSQNKFIEKGETIGHYKVTSPSDRYGFFYGESEYTDEEELLCYIGFTDRPSLY